MAGFVSASSRDVVCREGVSFCRSCLPMAQVEPDNLHPEQDAGPAQGNEERT